MLNYTNSDDTDTALCYSFPNREMSRLTGSIISALSSPHFALIVLQSSLVQSSLPVLRAFARSQDATTHILLFSLLYPPQTLVEIPSREGLTLVDRTTEVPGYGNTCPDLPELILRRIKQGVWPRTVYANAF
jgi:elongator complex protein 5